MINFFFYSIIFLFGLVVGSFLNCVIYRLEEKKSFLTGRSFCPYCKHKLSWQDLIPVFSFLLLKGKCRYCKKPISWQYPLVELATGLLFVLIFNLLTSEVNRLLVIGAWDLFFYLVIACFLIIIFVYDLKRYIILDKVIYPAIVIALIYHLLRFDLLGRSNLLFAAIGAAAFFLLIVLISREKWMGMGDVKLAFLMGLILGWPNILVALFSGFFLGAIIGAGLIISKRKTLKSQVPFAPFLIAGTFIALFLGQNIINWYLSLIIFNF